MCFGTAHRTRICNVLVPVFFDSSTRSRFTSEIRLRAVPLIFIPISDPYYVGCPISARCIPRKCNRITPKNMPGTDTLPPGIYRVKVDVLGRAFRTKNSGVGLARCIQITFTVQLEFDHYLACLIQALLSLQC